MNKFKLILFSFLCFMAQQATSQTYEWAQSIASNNTNDYMLPLGTNVDDQGNYYSLGAFIGTFDFDPGVGVTNIAGTSSVNGQDIYIQKFASNGNLLWAKGILSTNAYQECYGLELDANNNIFLTGTFSATVDFDPGTAVNNITPAGGKDFYVLKLDSAGSFVWVKTFGNTGLQPSAGSLDLAANGDVIIGGHFDGTLDFDPSSSFEDYEPQINVMPRLAFSFPISDEANFFAHYDILVQHLNILDHYLKQLMENTLMQIQKHHQNYQRHLMRNLTQILLLVVLLV